MVEGDEPDAFADPMTTIVSAIHHVRQDWQPNDVAALFYQSGIPRESLCILGLSHCPSCSTQPS